MDSPLQLFKPQNILNDSVKILFYVSLFIIVSLAFTVISHKIIKHYFHSQNFDLLGSKDPSASRHPYYLAMFARNAFILSMLWTITYHIRQGTLLSSLMGALSSENLIQALISISFVFLVSLIISYITIHTPVCGMALVIIGVSFTLKFNCTIVLLLISVVFSVISYISSHTTAGIFSVSSITSSVKVAAKLLTRYLPQIFLIVFSSTLVTTLMGGLIFDTLDFHNQSFLYCIFCGFLYSYVFLIARCLTIVLVTAYLHSKVERKSNPLHIAFVAAYTLFDSICYFGIFMYLGKLISSVARPLILNFEKFVTRNNGPFAIIFLILVWAYMLVKYVVAFIEINSDILFSRAAIGIVSDTKIMDEVEKLRLNIKEKTKKFFLSYRTIILGLFSVSTALLIYLFRDVFMVLNTSSPILAQILNIMYKGDKSTNLPLMVSVFAFMVLLGFIGAYSSAITVVDHLNRSNELSRSNELNEKEEKIAMIPSAVINGANQPVKNQDMSLQRPIHEDDEGYETGEDDGNVISEAQAMVEIL